jgi:hypothetical protein
MLVGPTGSDRAQFLFRLDQYVGRAKHALKVLWSRPPAPPV